MNIIDEETTRGAGLSRFISHLIVISMLFILPEFIMSYTVSNFTGGIPWLFYLKSAVFIFVFYINYYFIINRTLARRSGLWRFLLYNLIVLVAALVLSQLIFDCFAHAPSPEHLAKRAANPMKFRLRMLTYVLRDAVMIVLTVSLAVALWFTDRWLALERRRKDLVAERRESELKNLKSQLNPHFLFNTLNSIYALIEVSPGEARDAVHRLSQLLRYVLYEDRDKVALNREVDFVRNYILLMELRLGSDRVETDIDIAGHEDMMIAPLLFIVPVENAFKHGNTADRNDKISISVKADGDKVVCRTVNRFRADTVVDRGGGIGIANLRRRLHLIYGDRASLSTVVSDDTYTATLTIQLTTDDGND